MFELGCVDLGHSLRHFQASLEISFRTQLVDFFIVSPSSAPDKAFYNYHQQANEKYGHKEENGRHNGYLHFCQAQKKVFDLGKENFKIVGEVDVSHSDVGLKLIFLILSL